LGMNIIEMEQVTWFRDGKAVLNGIDWTVREGGHWAMLGLNGSGKTTLLNMISGYLWPTSGHISVLGNRFGEVDLRELRKTIGWVSSSMQARLHGGQKAEDLVVSGKFATIGLYEKPTSEDYDRAAAFMTQLHCRHLHGRTYQTCSQG